MRHSTLLIQTSKALMGQFRFHSAHHKVTNNKNAKVGLKLQEYKYQNVTVRC